MRKKNVIAGIDLGSYTVKAVIAQFLDEENIWQILGVGNAQSKGIRKGLVTDPDEVSQSVKESLAMAQHMSDMNPDEVWVGVGGNEIELRQAKGVVAIGRSDGEVSENDIERVLESSRNVMLSSNREVIHSIPKQYRLDDQHGIKDPLGMKGVRLEVDTLSIEGSSYQIKNLFNAFQSLNIEPTGLVLNPLAAAEVILDKQQKELGVVLIDIGAATTSLAVYEEGELVYTSIIPWGSMHITSDIAIGLRVSIELAEQIKLRYGTAFTKDVGKKEEVDLSELDSQETELVSRYHIAEIIEARLEEIFELINEELKKAGKAKLLPAGAVLVGGGSQMPQITEFAKDNLGLPVQIGYPHRLSGVLDKVDETSFAVTVGLVVWGTGANQKNVLTGNSFWNKIPGGSGDAWLKVKEWAKRFLP